MAQKAGLIVVLAVGSAMIIPKSSLYLHYSPPEVNLGINKVRSHKK